MVVKGTTLELDIANSESHYVGGDVLRGRAVFSVSESRGVSIREISMRLVCDIDISIGIQDLGKNSQTSNKHTRKMRLYDEEFPVYLEYSSLKQGIHAIPFSVTLPLRTPTLPPSVTSVVSEQTYGNISYFIEAKAKRSAWIFNTDIKAKAPFLFLPAHLVSQPEPLRSPSSEIEFTSYMGGSAEDKPRGLRKLLSGSKHHKTPPLALYCSMEIPGEGLRQDKPSNFSLTIRAANSETIMAKYLTLSIETVLVMESGGYAINNVVSSVTLVQQMILRSGNVLDLSDYMKNIKMNQLILPTFKTPIMSHYHRVSLKCMITRNANKKSGETMHIVENVPIVVLPPNIRTKSVASSMVPLESSQATSPDTMSVFEVSTPTHETAKYRSEMARSEHREYYEPISPTYSGSPHSIPSHDDMNASPPPYDDAI